MLFWSVIILTAVLVCGVLALSILRSEPAEADEANDVALYRDQLAEIDRDLARGVLAEDEAERSRTEVARRLLNADKAGVVASGEAPAVANRILAVGIVVVVGLGGLYVYRELGVAGYRDLPLATRIAESEELRASRISQADAEAIASELPASPVDAAPEYLAMVEQLREIAPERPDDLMAWALLSRHEAVLGNYVAAARAQERVLEIQGADVTTEDRIALVDRLVAAAAGFVSPEAEAELRRVLEEEPRNLPARYYMGLLYAQTDRPDIAFRLWREVVEGANGGVHLTLARAQIEDAAFRAGIEYTLPAERGPSLADIEAAGDMTEEDRAAMIQGMIAQLSDRLATEGGTAQDWARLITSLGVVGDQAQAAEIWAEARGVFGASEEAMEVLHRAADQAGVLE